jgi:hypothetical protein
VVNRTPLDQAPKQRPLHSIMRSSASLAMRVLRVPCSRAMLAMRSAWGSSVTAGPSTSISSTAAASVGRPMCSHSSTSRVVWRSMISMAAGTMPPAITRDTVRLRLDRSEIEQRVFDALRHGSRHRPR